MTCVMRYALNEIYFDLSGLTVHFLNCGGVRMPGSCPNCYWDNCKMFICVFEESLYFLFSSVRDQTQTIGAYLTIFRETFWSNEWIRMRVVITHCVMCGLVISGFQDGIQKVTPRLLKSQEGTHNPFACLQVWLRHIISAFELVNLYWPFDREDLLWLFVEVM